MKTAVEGDARDCWPLAARRAGACRPALALAQQFEKVENIPKQEIPAGPLRRRSPTASSGWRSSAYVVFVPRGLERVNQEIADLKRKLESQRAAATAAG